MQTRIQFLKESIFFHVQGLYSWAFSVINTDFSKYINDVLHVPIQMNAIYSSVPRIASVFVSIFTGFISDWMHEKRDVSLTTIRKTFAALCNNLFVFRKKINWIFHIICGFSASVIPSIFAMAASYAGCDEVLVVTLLTISIAGQGFNAAGTTLNMFDLGPNYIGPLTGVVNSVSTLASMLAPTIVGYLTPHVNQKKKFCIWKFWFFTYINRK